MFTYSISFSDLGSSCIASMICINDITNTMLKYGYNMQSLNNEFINNLFMCQTFIQTNKARQKMIY